MGFLSKLVPNELKGGGWVTPVATAAGFMLGGPAGAAAGSALGTKYSGGSWGDAAKAGALSYAGSSLFSSATGATGGGGGGFGNLFADASASGANQFIPAIANAADPIEAMYAAMEATGAQTATEAAQQLGYGSAQAMLNAINPAWVSTSGLALDASDMMNNAGFPNAAAEVAGSNTAAFGPGPGGFLNSMAQNVGLQEVPGETTMQRMFRMAKGAGSVFNVASGIAGLGQAKQMRALAKPGQEAARRMAFLEANPGAINDIPGYAAGKAAMIQARDRVLAQQGQTGGGMALEATMKSEGAYDAQFRNAELQRLQATAQGAVAPQVNYAELVSRALASIGYVFGPQGQRPQGQGSR